MQGGSVRIEHVAIWTRDLERLRRFYETYFGARANALYVNPGKGFESYFLSFADGARLELMRQSDRISGEKDGPVPCAGLTHLAFAAGSRDRVDALTRQLSADGYRILDGARMTGDGYYESTVLDPDGNQIEITV